VTSDTDAGATAPATTGVEAAATASVPPILADARALLPEIVEIRRRIHRHPEIGLELPLTQAVIVEELRALGLDTQTGKNVSSVTATIEGGRPGPTFILRADMDALPLQEETGLEFSSEVAGAMHACGHDIHVAMLLGAARLLLGRRDELAGRVLLMFQPGEEGFHGARSMLEEGLLNVPAESPVSGAFAIHIGTRYRTGTINVRPGPLLASSDVLRVTVRGRGGHASAPHKALDPITVASEIVLALQTMVTRRVDPFDPAVITIANVVAGTTNNIIPESAFLQGTIRTVSERTRKSVRQLARRVIEGIAAAHGASAEVEIEPGYPVTVNDPASVRLVREVAVDFVGPEDACDLDAPIMGAEDFSYVLQKVPGSMAFLGARPADEDPDIAPQNHSDRVVFDEDAMPIGVALYAQVALRQLAADRGSPGT
jgi:amidohydrolase